MQKWEYLVMTASWNSGWKIDRVNGQEPPNWKRGPFMHDHLNSLGEQGWEMVSMDYHCTFNQFGKVPDESYETYRIAMKRPKI